jgi:hypothetical protein
MFSGCRTPPVRQLSLFPCTRQLCFLTAYAVISSLCVALKSNAQTLPARTGNIVVKMSAQIVKQGQTGFLRRLNCHGPHCNRTSTDLYRRVCGPASDTPATNARGGHRWIDGNS